jgi:hypothetical protein
MRREPNVRVRGATVIVGSVLVIVLLIIYLAGGPYWMPGLTLLFYLALIGMMWLVWKYF